MRITRLKLVNFIGINSGMGKSEIEINIPDNGKRITMLAGGNGSGKSTIMSQLTPFKDTFDENRKNPIIKGKEGLKELDFTHEGHEYKVKHVYGKTTMCFISEDGVELNTNGGVKTFEDIMKQKFKLDKEYFKIGKIGSNTTSFVNYTTAQRKTFISTFVEAVQSYIDAFDIVSKKAKINKNQIEQIGKDLKKFDNIANIMKTITENEKALQDNARDITTYTELLADIKASVSVINTTLAKIDYSGTKALLAEKEKSLNKNYSINDKFKRLYPDVKPEEIDKTIEEKTNEINILNSEISKNNTLLSTEVANKVNCENDLAKVKIQIKSNNSAKLLILEKELKELKKTKKELDYYFETNSYAKALKSSVSKLPVYIDGFSQFLLTLINSYQVLNSCGINPSKRNADLFFGQDFSTIFKNYSSTVNNSLNENRTSLEEKNNEYSTKAANLCQLDILGKRPKSCNDDSCPFISNALQYKNLPNELVSLENIIAGIKNSIKSNEELVEQINDLKLVYLDITKAYKQLSWRENQVFLNFIKKYGNIATFCKMPLNDLNVAATDAKAEAEDIQDKINKLIEVDSLITLKETTFSNLSDSEKTRVYFQNEIDELNKKINNESLLIIDYTKIKNDLTTKCEAENLIYKDFTDYKTSINETSELEADVAGLKESISIYETESKNKKNKLVKQSEYDLTLTNLKKEKVNIEKNIMDLKVAEQAITQLNDNLTKLNLTYSDVSLVKQALDPKSGIPLVFIQSYLDGTEAIANELLNIVYHGQFEIKFIPTATDFYIQVRNGENVIDDIKSASQGEVALTTISISLALIERSLGEYNILCLDEIDGELDSYNRNYFIDILNKQINKLGIEQVFIISHNNSFDTCDMNLMLCPRNNIDISNDDFMKNKEIIFNAAD